MGSTTQNVSFDEKSLKPELPSTVKSKKIYVVTGLVDKPLYIGRHVRSTFRIPTDSKRISRVHCIIRWFKENNKFALKVIGANGIKYRNKRYRKNDIIDLDNDSIIDCVGYKILFKEPKDLRRRQILPIFSSSSASPEGSPLNTCLVESSKVLELSLDNKRNTTPLVEDKPKNTLKRDEIDLKRGSDNDCEQAKSQVKSSIAKKDTNDSKLQRKVSFSLKEEDTLLPKRSHSKSNSLGSISSENSKRSQLTKRLNNGKEIKSLKITQEESTSEDELFIDLILHTFAEIDKRTPVPLTELHAELSKVYPNNDFTLSYLKQRLDAFPMFVDLPNTGANESLRDGSYYYAPEKDWNKNRRIEIGTLIRKPRNCTLQSKQYYFKPPPKLPKYSGGSRSKRS